MRIIVLDHCPGCGKCVHARVCPTKAISIENGKAVIGQGCIECGLCLSTCPIGLIKEQEEPAQEIGEEIREEVAHEQTSTGA